MAFSYRGVGCLVETPPITQSSEARVSQVFRSGKQSVARRLAQRCGASGRVEEAMRRWKKTFDMGNLDTPRKEGFVPVEDNETAAAVRPLRDAASDKVLEVRLPLRGLQAAPKLVEAVELEKEGASIGQPRAV
eukprot:122292-Pleurochrysis_carterae.AAC.2